jgi:hypothetical protein
MVGFVMMIHVAQQQAGCGSVYDQPHVAGYTHRPEIVVPGLIQPVELQFRMRRIQL